MGNLRDLIVEILESRDFEMGQLGGHLAASKGELDVLFCILASDSDDDLEGFLETTADFDGRRVVATLGSPVRRLPEDVFLWDREAVEHEIGRMRLEDMLGEVDHGFVDELSANDYPRIITPEALERLGCQDLNDRILRPNVDIVDVRTISEQTVRGFRHHLELIPYYVYGYRCRVIIDGEDVGVSSGTVAVNALNQEIAAFKGNLDVVCDLDLEHRRMEPLLDDEDAETLVKREIIRKHTVRRDVTWSMRDAKVVEEQRFPPNMEDVEVQGLGIYYVPVWCVEGTNGDMYINANTGKVIRENFYRS